MSEIAEIKKELREVKSMLRQALPALKKETWVGVAVIQQVTGWAGSEKMRWARDNNLVQYDKKKGYLLESIPEMFLIKPNTHAAFN